VSTRQKEEGGGGGAEEVLERRCWSSASTLHLLNLFTIQQNLIREEEEKNTERSG